MYVRFAEDAERRVVAETEVAKQASQASMRDQRALAKVRR